MKKLISIMMLFAILFSGFNVISKEQQLSIADKIRSFMLVDHPEALDGIIEASYKAAKRQAENYIYVRTMEGRQFSDGYVDVLTEQIYNKIAAIPEYSFCFYPLITIRYSKQYADSFNFDELINENKNWVTVPYSIEYTRNYDENYNETLVRVKIYDKETIEFLTQPEMIEKMVKEQINEEIVDCKIVLIRATTIIYLKGKNTDYGIKIYSPEINETDPAYLESFKIYLMSELLESCANYEYIASPEALNTKPIYELEGNSLIQQGIIQGNENGLDPLKPLSRIEATTILVRTLGLEQTPVSQASMFSDISDDNWGVKYANIAYERGITKGVGDGMFAPNTRIDANQFSTMLLRNIEQRDFDWQEALAMLVEMGIITAEQADTMDLFTRGDMAKIIYEAREKGLLPTE